jgi:hypothetical protein
MTRLATTLATLALSTVVVASTYGEHETKEVTTRTPGECSMVTKYRDERTEIPAQYRVVTKYRERHIQHPAEYRMQTETRGGKTYEKLLKGQVAKGEPL